jgi:DNA-binding Lrp family transcriptional regulator
VHIKKLNKYLCKIEIQFLNRLYFWSSHKKEYGVEKDGMVWIYNTLEDWAEQLGVSKSSVRRAIKSLKNNGIINSDYLSPNKRNRTLYYAINHDAIRGYTSLSGVAPCVQKTNVFHCGNEHIDEHMYNSKQNINKSNKSKKNKIGKNSEQTFQKTPMLNSESGTDDQLHQETSGTRAKFTEYTETTYPKPTIIQDMLKIWNEEFSTSKIPLTKQLARFLVAAFKTKFESCLKEWRKYLKTLKTSDYITGDKFKLSIWWVIKFVTIDRVRNGELGVNFDRVTPTEEELTEKLNIHISSLNETEPCKKLRYKIIEKLTLPTYLSWFTSVSFVEDNEKIIMKANNQFVEDWIVRNFADRCGLCIYETAA